MERKSFKNIGQFKIYNFFLLFGFQFFFCQPACQPPIQYLFILYSFLKYFSEKQLKNNVLCAHFSHVDANSTRFSIVVTYSKIKSLYPRRNVRLCECDI